MTGTKKDVALNLQKSTLIRVSNSLKLCSLYAKKVSIQFKMKLKKLLGHQNNFSEVIELKEQAQNNDN